MRNRRHSTGYVRKQRGKWIGAWYVNGERTSKSLGLVKDFTKSDAKEKLAEIIRTARQAGETTLFGPFVEGPYFDFYSRKWKASTAENNKQRVRTHLVAVFRERALASFKRDELQDFLDSKGSMSFSVVDHLRWDLKQIFDMAIAEGYIRLNPALLLFTPREAKRPDRLVMTIPQVVLALQTLAIRERLIAKIAIVGGMRPGEIFGLTWDRVAETFAKVEQRVYRGLIDTPKTLHSVRSAALADRLLADLREWGSQMGQISSAYVFPSERMTPLSKDNVWRRNMQRSLKLSALAGVTFKSCAGPMPR
jgi:integrase